MVRILVLMAACAAVSGCMTSTRTAADAFYGSLFPTSNAPTAPAR